MQYYVAITLTTTLLLESYVTRAACRKLV